MIEFKQLASGTPPDIEVTTDDGDGELAELPKVSPNNRRNLCEHFR